MDEKKISQIAKQSPTAKAIFKSFYEKERNPRGGVSDTRYVRYDLENNGVKVVPKDFIETFRNLEKAGVGELLEEPGKPLRFRWATDAKDVAAKALGLPASVKRHFGGQRPKTNQYVEQESPTPSPKAVDARNILLPSGREITFNLPEDLDAEDAQALCRLIMRRSAR